jgi:hypothetical protein
MNHPVLCSSSPLFVIRYFIAVYITSAYLYYKNLFIFLQQHVFASLHHWVLYVCIDTRTCICVHTGYVNAKLYFHVLKITLLDPII